MRYPYENRMASRQAFRARMMCCTSRSFQMFTAMAMAEILCALSLIMIGIIIIL